MTIPGLVMDGVVDLGLVGENVLEEVRLERLATQLVAPACVVNAVYTIERSLSRRARSGR